MIKVVHTKRYRRFNHTNFISLSYYLFFVYIKMFDFQPVGNLWFLSRLYFGFLFNTLKYDKKDKNKLDYIFLLDLVRYLRLISLFLWSNFFICVQWNSLALQSLLRWFSWLPFFIRYHWNQLLKYMTLTDYVCPV